MPMLNNYFSSRGPGAALALSFGDETTQVECFGLADIQQGVAIDANTIFDLASLSKTFTATAIMLLVERGEIDLARPAQYFIPSIRSSRNRSITIKDLLAHTSGLRDYIDIEINGSQDGCSPEHILRLLSAWSSEAVPGKTHRYSNTNYFLLSKVIEAVADGEYPEFIRSVLRYYQKLCSGSVNKSGVSC